MDKIKEIKNRISIADLLNRLGLKTNSNGFIFSIYKDEKTPSLKIYFETNSFYDFATNNGGDVIDFYRDYYKTDNKTVIKELADMLNITDYNTNSKPAQNFKPKPIQSIELFKDNFGKVFDEEFELFTERSAIMEFDGGLSRKEAERYAYQDVQFYRTDVRHKVLESFYRYESKKMPEDVEKYLIGKRKLNIDTILDFHLFGINPQHSIKYLKDNFTEYQLKVSGLFKNNYFIFSKHKVIIPYIERGKFEFIKARSLLNIEPKYIGLSGVSAKRFYNRDILKCTNEIIICEGEFDCLKLIQETGNPVVAVGGVGNIPDLNILKDKVIYLSLDNDEAGKSKQKQLINELENIVRKIYNMKLPKNVKDISELLKWN